MNSRERVDIDLQLHHLYGTWEDDQGTQVKVTDRRKVTLLDARSRRKYATLKEVDGRFECAGWTVDMAQSTPTRVVWRGHEIHDDRVWERHPQ